MRIGLFSCLAILGCRPAHPVSLVPHAECPHRRTLAQVAVTADIIAAGKVSSDRDCSPLRFQGSRPELDCVGRQAYVLVSRSWKGPLRPGDGLVLLMPGPKDSAGVLIQTGDQVVLFAMLDLPNPVERTYWAHLDACMLPERLSSFSELESALDSVASSLH